MMRLDGTEVVAIRVNRETWRVPRGFGEAYKHEAREQNNRAWRGEPGRVIDRVLVLLGLIGYTATRDEVASWPLLQRVEAAVYAANVHAVASDNPIRRHPKPSWFGDPWKGDPRGEGVWLGPGPTTLRWPRT